MKYTPITKLTLLVAFTFISISASAQITVNGEPEVFVGTNNAEFMQPRFSPNGEHLAYTSARNIGLWITDLSNKNTKQITDASAGYGFSWSSDSESILTRLSETENRRRKHAVVVYDVNSSEMQQITEFRNDMPALPKWTNSDQNIVLFADNKIEAFESGKRKKLNSDADLNQSFYVLKSGSIATGKIPENSTADISPFEDAQYLNLEISPDGQKLAFEVYGGNLYVMNIDGTGLTDLGKASRAKWAPGSDYVVAMKAEDDGYTFTRSEIYALSIDGKTSINLTEKTDLVAMNPDWSPKGDQIAFDSPDTGSIYLLSITKQ